MKKNLLILLIFTCTFFVKSYAQGIEDGLVFYMPFDDGDSWNMAKDNSIEGTIFGGPIADTGFNGEAKGAMSFALGDYVEFNADDIINLPIGESDRTIASWFNTSMTTGEAEIVSYGTQEKGKHQHLDYHVGDSVMRAGYWYKDYDYTCILNDGQWHHVALTASQESDKFLLYLDGVLQAGIEPNEETKTLKMNTSAGTILRIASRNQSGGGMDFIGKLDEIRIYNRALSEEDITALYKFNPASTTGSKTVFNSNSVKVYPTFANNFINVKSNLNFSKVEIINIDGKVVKCARTKRIDVTELSNGIYFVKVNTNNGNYSTKFIKQ